MERFRSTSNQICLGTHALVLPFQFSHGDYPTSRAPIKGRAGDYHRPSRARCIAGLSGFPRNEWGELELHPCSSLRAGPGLTPCPPAREVGTSLLPPIMAFRTPAYAIDASGGKAEPLFGNRNLGNGHPVGDID
jgi:hypothetical protein